MTQPGGFNFDEIRKMLQQMGLMGADGELDFEAVMRRMQQMQTQGGAMFGMTPADQDPDAAWRTTLTAAKHATEAAGPDPSVTPEERSAVVDAARLAQSWLDDATTFTDGGAQPQVLTRAQWLDRTGDGWRAIVEPIIDGLGDALERTSSTGGDAPEGFEGFDLGAMMGPLMKQSAAMMYRDRLKRELSQVARDTLTGAEIGLNLAKDTAVTVLPANVAAFTKDLDGVESDLLLVLLLREAARQRLFHRVGWLSPQLLALMSHYAREITIDLDAIAEKFSPERMEQLSVEDLGKIGEEVQVSFFRPASTPEQLDILDRLGVLLALVEGWVDHVTGKVMAKWMPHAPQLVETLRRRRAAGGPVRQVFQELMGLELTPRLVRDAENLWAAVEHDRGLEGRDQVWSHPDLLPTAAHLADPLSFVQPAEEEPGDDLDAELRKLLGD